MTYSLISFVCGNHCTCVDVAIFFFVPHAPLIWFKRINFHASRINGQETKGGTDTVYSIDTTRIQTLLYKSNIRNQEN